MLADPAHSGQLAKNVEKAQRGRSREDQEREEAAEAVRELQRSGVDMQKLSIVGKDCQTQEDVVGYYTAGDRMKAVGEEGSLLGRSMGAVFGAFFLIPGSGAPLAARPLVAWIVGALEGAVVVGGVSALDAGPYSIGIPKDSIIEYDTQIKAGKFLVIAHGSPGDVAKSKSAMAMTRYGGMTEHACCA